MKYIKAVLVGLAIGLLMIPGVILFWVAYIALSIASLLAVAAGWLMGDHSSWQECFEFMARDLALESELWTAEDLEEDWP
jgi:hypothetical protein